MIKMENRSKGVGKGSRDLLLKFWDALVISGTFELQTSNLACRLITGALMIQIKNYVTGCLEGVT